MQILLSCAKTMADHTAIRTPRTTEPRFQREADAAAAALASLPADDLARILRVNRTIAAENRRRYASFHDAESLAALAAYTGIVFKRLDPGSFTDDDFEYAQEHLNITSFLYGLLRPLDAIRPYRLEGDTILPGEEEQTRFDFWRQRLTDGFIRKIQADDGVLLNLASGEMKRLFDWRRLAREVRIITPEFRIHEGDRLKTIVVYTKMCRGEMARFALKGRIDDPESLKTFEWEGFQFDAARSRDDNWVFTM